MELLRDLADQSGRTLGVVLHEVNYAAAHADHIVALRDGCVAGAGRPGRALDRGRDLGLFRHAGHRS